MMYIWNGYTVIGKHKDLTEGMLKTLDEAQKKLDSCPSMQNHLQKPRKLCCCMLPNLPDQTCSSCFVCCVSACVPGTDLSIDDQCLLSLLKGLCLKHLGHQEEAEHYFTLVLCK